MHAEAIGKEQEGMAFLLKRTMFVLPGLLVMAASSGAFAQGRMGMMMARQQMAVNAGMMGQLNPGLIPNLTPGIWPWNTGLYGNRGYGYPSYGGYGGGYSGYAGNNSSDYSGGVSSYSSSYPRRRNYADESPPLSPQEERERVHEIELSWSQGELSEFETQTGTALNILLDDLRHLHALGIRSSDMTLDEEMLRHINVRMGRSNGNLGLFKENGQLSWPLLLRRPEFQRERDRINVLAPKVIEQAKHGQNIDLSELAQAMQTIQARLHARIGDIPTPDYVKTKRFLTQLDDAIKLLRQPDAGKYFDQTYAAHGKTVADLVRYMTQLDLHFAPAVEGDEPAYQGLHRILAAYDRTAHSRLLARN
jgi:hypothetical protein